MSAEIKIMLPHKYLLILIGFFINYNHAEKEIRIFIAQAATEELIKSQLFYSVCLSVRYVLLLLFIIQDDCGLCANKQHICEYN